MKETIEMALKDFRVVGVEEAIRAYKIGYEIRIKYNQIVKAYHKDGGSKPNFDEVYKGVWHIHNSVRL